MPRFDFKLGFKTTELQQMDLPVEIRAHDSSLVTRTFASKAVDDLKPGLYYATASLPAGQRLLKVFEVKDADGTIELTPQRRQESAHEWEEASHFLHAHRPPSGASRLMADAAPVVTPLKAALRIFRGDPFRGVEEIHPSEAGVHASNVDRGRAVQLRIARQTGEPLLVQLLQADAPVRNMVVPAAPSSDVILIVKRRQDGSCGMEFEIGNVTAAMLLRYCSADTDVDPGKASRVLLEQAEQLLHDKTSGPLYAAIGATALLRFGDLDLLHDWTGNLAAWFPWLPDGAAIRGEHLAREGDHAGAAKMFEAASDRGLPMLADSIFYAVERLKRYSELGGPVAARAGIDPGGVQRSLGRLQPFAAYLHRRRPLTSFCGFDPMVPSVEPAPVLSTASSLDLAGWLDEGGMLEFAGAASEPAMPAGTVSVTRS